MSIGRYNVTAVSYTHLKAKGGAISGAINGLSGGLLGVMGKAATSSAQVIQGTMSKNITTATILTEQGATQGTVKTAVNGITQGMGTVAGSYTHLLTNQKPLMEKK